ncbi:MAG: type II toxin-antitoxin system ParD family antitoxin [Erythrobacter sp.]|nr:type II toxin-antitoxin system ParD family antitoxin [Erythrobacter sp.]
MISADLGETLEEFVRELVSRGRYNSKSEVLREGVRLVQDREARLVALNGAIAEGLQDLFAGRVIPADQVFDDIKRELQEKFGPQP